MTETVHFLNKKGTEVDTYWELIPANLPFSRFLIEKQHLAEKDE